MSARKLPLPPLQLREGLARQRASGVESFDEAWAASWLGVRWPHDTVQRRQWKEALMEMRPEWQAAYEGRATAQYRRVCMLNALDHGR